MAYELRQLQRAHCVHSGNTRLQLCELRFVWRLLGSVSFANMYRFMENSSSESSIQVVQNAVITEVFLNVTTTDRGANICTRAIQSLKNAYICWETPRCCH